MRSTFFGFEIARSAIQASQTGLDVTGQNMANINTRGYSRQAVAQKALSNSSSTYKYAQLNTTISGHGVSSGDIIQIRDHFLDIRFRNSNSEYNNLSTSLSILRDIETVFDETQNDGLTLCLGIFIRNFKDFLETPEMLSSQQYSALPLKRSQKH